MPADALVRRLCRAHDDQTDGPVPRLIRHLRDWEPVTAVKINREVPFSAEIYMKFIMFRRWQDAHTGGRIHCPS